MMREKSLVSFIKARTVGGANASAACLSQLGARLAHDEAGTLGGLSD